MILSNCGFCFFFLRKLKGLGPYYYAELKLNDIGSEVTGSQ